MKMVVAGGRMEGLSRARIASLVAAINEHGVDEIVTGGCIGIDQDAEHVARSMGLKTTTFRPSWDKHGKAAGPLRNAEMAAYADICLVFPGGRGTKDMADKMRSKGKLVLERE